MATSSQASGHSDKPSPSLPPVDHPDKSRSSQDETAKTSSPALRGVEKAEDGRGDSVEVKESEAVVADEIKKEEESQEVLDEVMRIKAILMIPDQSEDVLFDSLSILQQTKITVDVLQETMIGKAVNAHRRHTSKKIRRFVRSLIIDWRAVVDQWVAANASSEVQEEELGPSAQLEEGASSAAAPTPSAEKKASPAKGAAVAEEEAEPQRTSTEQVEPVLAQPDLKPGLDVSSTASR